MHHLCHALRRRIDGSDKFLPVNISDTKKRNHVFPFRGTYEDLPPSDMHAIEVRQSTCYYVFRGTYYFAALKHARNRGAPTC